MSCRLQQDRDEAMLKQACVLMRQLYRDKKNTHGATQETSAGLPKVIPLNEKQTAC